MLVAIAEIIGLVGIGLAGAMMFLAWPKNGQKRPFLKTYTIEVAYTLAMMFFFVGGLTSALYGVLA